MLMFKSKEYEIYWKKGWKIVQFHKCSDWGNCYVGDVVEYHGRWHRCGGGGGGRGRGGAIQEGQEESSIRGTQCLRMMFPGFGAYKWHSSRV